MLDFLFTNPLYFVLWILALLVAITIHEFAHAWAANQLGDPTAKLQGRLTLNPLAHLDPVGTIAMLIFRFGWGKPVPVDSFNLKDPRKDSALISLSGPASNFILAIILSLILRAFAIIHMPLPIIDLILTPVIIMCVMLGVFNLLPFHPLDGGKILIGILPEDLAKEWDSILSQYGFFLLLLFIFPLIGGNSLITLIISPFVNFILSFLLPTVPFLI